MESLWAVDRLTRAREMGDAGVDDIASRLAAMTARIDDTIAGVVTQDFGFTGLSRAIEMAGKMEALTPRELVDTALEHMPSDLSALQMAILHELCSRVQPGWERQ